MVALFKHQTITPREHTMLTRTGRLRKAKPAMELRPALPPVGAESVDEEVSPKHNEQPKPPESAKGKEILGVEAEERVQERRSREPLSYDVDATFKLYLREIGQVKLLTPQEEIELAARIKRGDKKADRKSTRLNSSHLGISYAVFCFK